MGLPGGEHIELTGHRQHVLRHAGAEALDVPFLRAMETQLAIETGAADLGGHLQIQHPGKTAAVGVGGVVITGPLHI